MSSSKSRSLYAACTRDYYSRAIDRIRSEFPAAVFYAFSDDPRWVREVLAPQVGSMRVIDHNRGPDSHFDMQLMSACKHHIIANSSFSWWGAWLNPDVTKMVVAPGRWYSVDSGLECDDLIPTGWIRIL